MMLETLSSYCGSNYVKPFTVKDPSNAAWTIATDKVWFAATQTEGPYPRLLAGIDALNKVLSLIKATPENAITFNTESAVTTLEGVKDRYVQVLNVVVERDRLLKIIKDVKESEGFLWNASTLVGVPALGISLKNSSRWFLTGWSDVEKFKSLTLQTSLEDFLY